MQHRLIRLLFCAILVLLPALPREARAEAGEQRIALVVGIGAYAHAPELPNPRNDARAMTGALRKLGFKVEEKFDLDNRGLAEALRNFGVQAAEADVALLYFAGHGMQVGGTNYILPSDARLERERDLVYEALPLNLPLGELAQARKLGILILDACRNNPFADRLVRSGTEQSDVHSGFTRIEDTPSDTLVAMATRADAVAEDGANGNSPYTASLLRHFEVPGLELSLFFRRVRDDVLQATSGRQEPYIYGSLGAAPFYFNPLPENRPPQLGDIKPLEVFDRGGTESFGIARPTDPDRDQLFAQVTGLPRGGAVRISDRVVLIGDYLTADQLAGTTFKPDASHLGDGGSFEFAVMDGRGGVARAAVPVLIKPSNRPPVVAAERTVRTVVNPLHFDVPTDPDGDTLTFTVNAVPERGRIRDGVRSIKPGDRLTAEQLSSLSYDAEQAPAGRAGLFSVLAEDGRGGRATASIVLEVEAAGAPPPAADLEEALWRRVRDSEDAEQVEAFMNLFEAGPFAGLARDRLRQLKAASPRIAMNAGATGMASDGPGADVPPQRAPVELKVEPTGEGVYVAVARAPLRAGPDNRSEAVGQVERGSHVRVLGRVTDADWYRVSAAGPSGEVQGFLPGPALRPAGLGDRQRLAMAEPVEISRPRSHGAGKSFQDCPDCPTMVRIAAGSYNMGADRGGDPTERPVHRVSLRRPFAIGVYEVTVGEFRACVESGGCLSMPRMTNAADNTPVYNVSWDDAVAYAAWLTRKTGHRYRLPTEAEWEYAARGGGNAAYAWGDSLRPDMQLANCRGCGGAPDQVGPVAVGRYEPNGFGLHDMSGGVAEWVADCWNPSYKGAPDDGSAWNRGDCRKRVLRGGSWRDEPGKITVTTRIGYDAGVRYLADGFRVARDLY